METRAKLTAWDLLASLGDSAAVVDEAYRIVWAREPLLDNFEPGVTAIGKPCYEVFAGRTSPCGRGCPVGPVFATGRPQMRMREGQGPDGRTIRREARAWPIMDRRGRIVFVARVSYDVAPRENEQTGQSRQLADMHRAIEDMTRLEIDELPFQPDPQAALTKRELEVLRLLAQGLSNPGIAKTLTISLNTVKRHVLNIFNKLGVNDRTQAAVWAARQNLV
jgi:DNA-binding CsgD family transcriptional regulator